MGMVKPIDDAALALMASRFRTAQPYPHIVLDDFLTPEGRSSLGDFPGPDWPHWSRFGDEYQKEKRVCANIDIIPHAFSQLISECGRPAFLRQIEAITGVGQLMPDPYLDGGGLHASGGGGILAPHTDFHVYQRLGLYRMLNLLIYLNDDWGPQDGGELELYAKGETKPTASVAPVFGRAVIFKTDDASVHGFTKPVAAGKWRRSVALYYYCAQEGAGFSGDTGTHWQSHGRMRGARLATFNTLILASRAFSRLAHMINPNQKIRA